MSNLSASVLQDIENISWILAKQARERFDAWQAGEVYIPKSALRSMAKRYLVLRRRDDLSRSEVIEFGRLYAWFNLVYPPDGDIPSPSAVAVDFCNLLSCGLPVAGLDVE